MLHLMLLALLGIILAIAYAGNYRCAGSTPRPSSRGDRNPGWVVPLLVLMVLCLGIFGMAGAFSASRPRRMVTVSTQHSDLDDEDFEFDGAIAIPHTARSGKTSEVVKKWLKIARDKGVLAKARVKQATDPVKDQPSEWPIVGSGENAEQAKLDALNKAREKVADYLQLHTEIPEDFVKEKLITFSDEPKKHDLKVPGVDYYQVNAKAKLTPDAATQLLRIEQHSVSELRVLFLAKVLAGVLAVMLTIAAYVRLDEWSKGYYTGWLRLAAAGFIAASAFSLWLLAGY
jgi:hypothetical protein